MMDETKRALLALAGLIFAIFFAMITQSCTDYSVRKEAITAGVAEYTVNPQTGDKPTKPPSLQ